VYPKILWHFESEERLDLRSWSGFKSIMEFAWTDGLTDEHRQRARVGQPPSGLRSEPRTAESEAAVCSGEMRAACVRLSSAVRCVMFVVAETCVDWQRSDCTDKYIKQAGPVVIKAWSASRGQGSARRYCLPIRSWNEKYIEHSSLYTKSVCQGRSFGGGGGGGSGVGEINILNKTILCA
jgi:uncharacterized membrane protein YgcG